MMAAESSLRHRKHIRYTFKAPEDLCQRFAYAAGRIGTLEKELLQPSDLDLLIGAPSSDALLRNLKEIPLLGISIGESPWQSALSQTAKRIKENVDDMVSEKASFIFAPLWIHGDRALVSYLVKEKRKLTSEISELPSPPVTVFPSKIWNALIETASHVEYVSDSPIMREVWAHWSHLVLELIKDSRNLSPQTIDAEVSQASATLAVTLAEKSGSPAILTYVRHMIDIENVRMLIRVQRVAKSTDHPPFLIGGTISIDILMGPLEHLASTSDRLPFMETPILSLFQKNEDVNMLVIEKALASGAGNDLDGMERNTIGPEPIFKYAIRALQHIEVLRIVILGKLYNLSPQDIRLLLPPLL